MIKETNKRVGDKLELAVSLPISLTHIRNEVVKQLYLAGLGVNDIAKIMRLDKSIVSRLVRTKGRRLSANKK